MATVAGRGAGAVPATVTAPFIPACSWPGIEQMNVNPPSGMDTVPVSVAPAAAGIFVPSAKVMSCGIAPVLWKVTS